VEEHAYPECSWLITAFVACLIVIVTVLPFPTYASGPDFVRTPSPYLFGAFACLTLPPAFLDPRGTRVVAILAPLLCAAIEAAQHVMYGAASAAHFALSILGVGFGVAAGRSLRWAILTRSL
jgi:hypothetical protein